MKILMLCLGNICRSPLAEILLAQKIAPQHSVDSAGTINYHQGKQADSRSIAVAQKHGLDLNDHRSRPLTKQDFKDFDLIFCMDKQNFQDATLLAKTEEEKSKLKLILDHIDVANRNVPDPYYGGDDGFEQVYQLLDKATDALVQHYHLNKNA